MKHGIKRTICLVFALVLLLSFVACGGGKKDQVVHEGETVQYGDLTFTFEKQYVGRTMSERLVGIKLFCEYKGQSQWSASQSSFTVYANGKKVESLYGDRKSRVVASLREIGYVGDVTEVSLTSGRSSELWICATAPVDTEKLEFDYVLSEFSDRWGKITFAVDTPLSHKPIDNALVGTWMYTKNVEGFLSDSFTEEKYVFNSDGTGSWIYNHDDYLGQHEKTNINFSFVCVEDNLLILDYGDSGYRYSGKVFFMYSIEGNQMTEYYTDGTIKNVFFKE